MFYKDNIETNSVKRGRFLWTSLFRVDSCNCIKLETLVTGLDGRQVKDT